MTLEGRQRFGSAGRTKRRRPPQSKAGCARRKAKSDLSATLSYAETHKATAGASAAADTPRQRTKFGEVKTENQRQK